MFPIFEKLGGWTAVQSLLEKRGLAATEMARRQWRSRQKLPVNVRLALQLECAERGIAATDDDCDFIRTQTIAAE